MKITINEKEKKMIIEIDLQTPAPSKSGKTLVIASTHGNVQVVDATISGKPVTIGINAYIQK